MKNAIKREDDKKRITLLVNFTLAFASMIGLMVVLYMFVNGRL